MQISKHNQYEYNQCTPISSEVTKLIEENERLSHNLRKPMILANIELINDNKWTLKIVPSKETKDHSKKIES